MGLFFPDPSKELEKKNKRIAKEAIEYQKDSKGYSTYDYVRMITLSLFPMIGWIYCIAGLLSKKVQPNKKNFIRGMLGGKAINWVIIIILLYIIQIYLRYKYVLM